MQVHVAVHIVVVYLLLQCLKLVAGLIVITLKLGCSHQFFILLLAQLVIGESSLYHTLLKLGIVGIRQMEVGCRGDGGVLGDIVHHVVEHHLRRIQSVQVKGNVGHRVRLHLHVRFDTLFHLDTTTARQIIARSRQLQVGIVRQVYVRYLHQSFTKGACTNYHTTLQVLQCTTGNL